MLVGTLVLAAGLVVITLAVVLTGGSDLLPQRKSASAGADGHHDDEHANAVAVRQTPAQQFGNIVLYVVLALIVSACFMVLGHGTGS